MERRVGELFTYKGKIYKVVPSLETCNGCAFNNGTVCLDEPLKSRRGKCAYRKNKQSVIFVELNNMEIKDNQLTIDIPKGMEIDTEKSDLVNGIIKFKNKELTYVTIYEAFEFKEFTNVSVLKCYRDRLSAISQLMNIAKYYNGNWQPNWSNSKENKYCIKFDYHKDRFYVDYNNSIGIGDIFFKNSEDAKAVIDNPNFRDILDAIYKK